MNDDELTPEYVYNMQKWMYVQMAAARDNAVTRLQRGDLI